MERVPEVKTIFISGGISNNYLKVLYLLNYCIQGEPHEEIYDRTVWKL